MSDAAQHHECPLPRPPAPWESWDVLITQAMIGEPTATGALRAARIDRATADRLIATVTVDDRAQKPERSYGPEPLQAIVARQREWPTAFKIPKSAKVDEWERLLRKIKYPEGRIALCVSPVEIMCALNGYIVHGDHGQSADWLPKSLLLVRDHPDWPDSKIADEVGVHRGTLSKSDEYRRAAAISRAAAQGNPHRGYQIEGTTHKALGRTGSDGQDSRRSASAPRYTDISLVAVGPLDIADDLDATLDRGQLIPGSDHYREYCVECRCPMRVTLELVNTRPVCADCAPKPQATIAQIVRNPPAQAPHYPIRTTNALNWNCQKCQTENEWHRLTCITCAAKRSRRK